MTAWHIDALDVRAGMAVATLRSADLTTSSEDFDTGPSVFIAPPAFVPEFIDSRAIGFGLARGRAQIGLFVDETEVSFPSPEAVAEFVRRTFLGGSSGDGPEEGGGSVPPGGPDRPSPPIESLPATLEDGDPVSALKTFVKHFRNCVGNCADGEAPEITRLVVEESLALGSARLLHGATRVRFTLLDMVGAGDDAVWTASAQRLVVLLYRLGLGGPAHSPSGSVTPRIAIGSRSADVQALFHLLNSGHPWFGPGWLGIGGGCIGTGASGDPFEDLAYLPTPLWPVRARSGSLQALLSAFMASPAQTLPAGPYSEQDVLIELVLLAACSLVLGGDRSLAMLAHDAAGWAVAANQLAKRAMLWLSDNLPKHAFTETVETTILEAAAVPA